MLLLTLLACLHRADLAFTGGPVYAPASAPAEALAVRGDRIVYVGDEAGLEPYLGRRTERVDLSGGALFPGFIDAHNHLLWSGTEGLDVDLYAATTLDELLAAIAERAEASPEEPWVRGGGWDVSLFNASLNRGQLDAIVPDRPVYMSSADGHSAWVNSRALALAGVSAATPDPPGGIIERDAAGEPTGVLREDAASLVSDLLPDYSRAQAAQGLREAQSEANSYGLTTVIDPFAEEWMLAAYRRADRGGRLTVRVYAALEVPGGDPAQAVAEMDALRRRYSGGRLTINAGKLYIDGVIESKTARMIEPYADGSNGELLTTDAALLATVLALDAAGYQVHAHAIGDGAVRQILDAVAGLEAQRGPADRRPLIAHIEVIDPEDVPRFAALGAYADFQMLWAYPDPYITDWTIPFIGEERARSLYPIGSVYRAGGTIVAGSDWSVSSMNPWEAIEVAVTRRDPVAGGEALNAEQAIPLEVAIAAYTEVGARAVFAEGCLGSLEVGKKADLVLVDRDPFTIDPAELSEVRVLGTWVDGARVYGGRTRRLRRVAGCGG